ncbi:MAG: Galactose-1-phosphate uridylyltransferase, partial [Pelotomaculum thermopropionicum]
MSEWRKDPISGRWVVIATERGKRPFNYNKTNEEKKSQECPFCEGNEHKTPPEIIAYRKKNSVKDHPGWWIRVVPNKYPALVNHGDILKRQCGVHKSMEGIGVHEVIVESTMHEPGLDRQAEEQVAEVIWAWRDRLLDLRRDVRLKYIQIFKNNGSAAGASLEHTHSQIVAMPMVPLDVRR